MGRASSPPWFHAKYPLIDSQSEREFAFSYAILRKIAYPLTTADTINLGQRCEEGSRGIRLEVRTQLPQRMIVQGIYLKKSEQRVRV